MLRKSSWRERGAKILISFQVNVEGSTSLNSADVDRLTGPKTTDRPKNRNKGPVECSDCGAILSSKHCLYKHRLAKHPKLKPAVPNSKLACKECNNEW